MPNSTVPNATVPNSTVPNSTVPNSTVPNATVPNATVPNSTVLGRGLVLLGVGLAANSLLGPLGVGRWLPAIIDATSAQPSGDAYLDNPTAFWLIAWLDLGIVVPAAITAAVGLRRRRDWARKAAYAVIGWFSLVPASVAAMAIAMQANDDPLASTTNTIVMTVAGAVFTVAAVWLLRPLLGERVAASPAPAVREEAMV